MAAYIVARRQNEKHPRLQYGPRQPLRQESLRRGKNMACDQTKSRNQNTFLPFLRFFIKPKLVYACSHWRQAPSQFECSKEVKRTLSVDSMSDSKSEIHIIHAFPPESDQKSTVPNATCA
jgi:hypothetical protein